MCYYYNIKSTIFTHLFNNSKTLKNMDITWYKFKNNKCYGFVLLTAFIILSGCYTIKEVKIGNVSKVELKGMNNNVVSFDLTLPIENPNNLRVKVKVEDLKVMLGNKELGTVKQMDKIVIARNSKQEYTIRIAVEITDPQGGMNSAFSFFSGRQPDIRLTGKVKASAFFYRKTFELNDYKLVQ